MTLVEKGAFDILTAQEWNELIGVVRNPYVRKTSNQTVNNSTVLVSDTQLTVPITRINSNYTFILFAIINTNSTANIKFGWSVPAGATMEWGIQEGSPANLAATFRGPETAAGVFGINGAGADQLVRMEGNLNVAGATGDFTLRWAQNTANASNTQVKTGSRLQLWPV